MDKRTKRVEKRDDGECGGHTITYGNECSEETCNVCEVQIEDKRNGDEIKRGGVVGGEKKGECKKKDAEQREWGVNEAFRHLQTT